MNSRVRLVCTLPLLLLFILCVPPIAVAGDSQWIEITSPHFSVVTDAGERRGREVAVRFEQMRSVFSTLLANAKVNIPIPLQIVAFRNTKELRQIAPLWNGKPIQLAGLFQPGRDRSFIMLDMSVDNPWQVVFHEYAHQLMNGTLSADIDPWFEEGFAQYFSTVEVDSKQARVGKIPDYEFEILRQRGMMKVSDLFRVAHHSSTYNENGDRRTVFYAESSIVVHYLYDNQMIPKVATYLDLKFNKNVPVDQAIEQAFGMSVQQFDKVLQSYVRVGQFRYFQFPTPPDIVNNGYTVKQLRAEDGEAVIADIHLHSPDYRDKAVTEFQEILKADPTNEAACRGLGYAYMEQRNFGDAREYFHRAVQADSKDPRVHYYYGLLMQMEGGAEDPSEMIKELQTAIALDPNFADAYMLLAIAQASSGDPAAGLINMKKAVELNPRNPSYYFNLAQMYLENKQVDQAIPILAALARSSDQEVSAKGQMALLQAQHYKQMMEQVPTKVWSQSANSDSSEESTPEEVGETKIAALKERSENAKTPPPEPEPQPAKVPPPGAIRFMKGTVTGVDCSSPPSATLTVASGGKDWKLQVADSKHVLVLGEAGFSCAWARQKVALNFRETGENAGSVVSIEIQ